MDRCRILMLLLLWSSVSCQISTIFVQELITQDFAAHGSGQGGINGAPSMVLGTRQVMQSMLRPFKAVMDLGGAKGVMMAYSELDAVPSHINPILYKALDDWGFGGFVIADDTGMAMLEGRHHVASSPADAIKQWFNAGMLAPR
jgi:beta-glucosidase-like glycosyl hydrolase